MLEPWESVVGALESFWGGPGRTAVAAVTPSTAAGLAIRGCGRFFGDKPDAHLLVFMQGRGENEGILQAHSCSVL